MANETGTKLSCAICGAQVAVTKGGAGEAQCCAQPMTVIAGQRQAPAVARPRPTQNDDPYYD